MLAGAGISNLGGKATASMGWWGGLAMPNRSSQRLFFILFHVSVRFSVVCMRACVCECVFVCEGDVSRLGPPGPHEEKTQAHSMANYELILNWYVDLGNGLFWLEHKKKKKRNKRKRRKKRREERLDVEGPSGAGAGTEYDTGENEKN